MQFTLRKLQALFVAPRFWGVLVAVALILGVAGPFETFSQMPLLPRIAYWLAVALLTFTAGYATNLLTLGYLLGGIGPRPLRLALSGFAAGLPVTLIVVILNRALFDAAIGPPGKLVAFYLECSLIAAGISFVFGLIDSEPSPATGVAATLGPGNERPAIMARLPVHLRGRLCYMTMQDHYVAVHTDRGSTLVLMRFADAIAEARPVSGVQIHRSHWVALDAVANSGRSDGRVYVKMSDGVRLPVSRGFQAGAKEAGLV